MLRAGFVVTVLSIVPMMIPHLLFSVSWALLLGLSLVPFVLGQIVRQIQKH